MIVTSTPNEESIANVSWSSTIWLVVTLCIIVGGYLQYGSMYLRKGGIYYRMKACSNNGCLLESYR